MIEQLRKKFIRIAMLSVIAVLFLLGLIVNGANYISVCGEEKEMLRTIAENQGTIPAPPTMKDDEKGGSPEKAMEHPGDREAPYSTRYFVLRYHESGELVKGDFDHIAAVTAEDADTYVQIAETHGVGFGLSGGYRYYVLDHGNGRYMAVFLDCYKDLRSVAVFALLTVVAILLCVAFVYILVVLFSRRAIEPMVRNAKEQKQFITDASHELKTPITVIATSLKVLEMDVGPQKWIDKALLQTEKLKELVNALVSLSRLDEDDSPLKMRPFSISDAVADTAESFVDFGVSQGHPLEIAVAPGISYCGDEYAIRQLISILLDNALKYGVADTPVRLSLEKEKKEIVIKTENRWNGADGEDVSQFFHRFYRRDPARSGNGGFGIGLSLAQSIAEGHKGKIHAVAKDGKIQFIVELPWNR